jgi:hypothetical protein
MKKAIMAWLLIPAVALALTACSGDGGTAPTVTPNPITTTSTDTTAPIPPTTPTTPAAQAAAQVLTGIFTDAPVEGLTFVSGAQSGITDAAGTFKFEAGKTVQFRVGNVILGQAPGKALMTPVDLVKAVDAAATVADPRVVQITQFLMTVNSSTTAAKMTIPGAAVTAAQNETGVDLSQTAVDGATLAALLGRLTTHPLVTTAAAAAHIQAALTTFTPAQIIGTFAAVDSPAAPTLGLRLAVAPNLAGNGFDVTGVAASTQGSTWTIGGTMTTDGSLQATGVGTGASPPANMVITGAMTAATQITAGANFTLNNVAKQVPVIFERAAAPATVGKLALPTDPGVSNATQIQHMAASLTILADGRVSAHLVEGEVTGLPLAPVLGGRSVDISGVVTSTGSVIAIGGTPGAGETTLSRSTTAPSSVVLLTGTANADGTVSAKVAALDITGGGAVIPPLSFVKATNALAGVYLGTHSDPPNPPGTTVFGVNNDGSVHGYTRFLTPGARFPEGDFLIDGVVSVAGVLGVPPGFNIGNLGAIAGSPGVPGLVMTDDEGNNAGAFVGTFGGTIDPATGAVAGNWTTGPVIASGTFSVNLLP